MIGTTLAHYRITGELGAGGMGEVWRAQDTKLGRDVALKVLSEEFADDAERLERFEREARAVATLNHPHIVTIFSVEEAEGTRFLTMELIEGRSLDKLIPEGGLDLAAFLELATPLAEAISAAHDKSVIHRDLKPSNVMVDGENRVKVLDFGLAKMQGAEGVSDASELPTEALTGVGTLVGTVPYMSPEQIEGEIVDHRTDIFSLGVLLYEMAVGERPFQGKSSPSLMSSILKDAPTPLVELRSDLPRHLGRIIGRCLEKDRRDRYQTARDVFNELRALQREASSMVPAPANLQTVGPQSSQRIAQPSQASATIRRDQGFWVAVRPFTYSGGDADVSALAEGLSEEVVTGLSRFSYLRVIARDSEARDARYVIEGSFRKAGTRLRLAVKLVDVATGTHLWAENYERNFDPETVFELQDDLVPKIVSSVGDAHGILPHTMSESLRGRAPHELTPYEAVLRAFGQGFRRTSEEHATVRACLERAVEESPRYADAWAMLALSYVDEQSHGYNQRPDPLGRALEAARRAAEAAPSNAMAYNALAWATFFRGDFQAFRTAAEQSIALNPLNSPTLAGLGALTAYSGDWECGCALVERALELNPRHPGWYWFPLFYNAYRNGDYRDAVNLALKFNLPDFFVTHEALAAAYGQLGEEKAAGEALAEMIRLKPDYAETGRARLETWFDQALVEHMMDGIRKAGLEVAEDEDKIDVAPVRHSSAEQRADEGFWVAVTPFKYTGDHEDLNVLADGLSEDIVTGLSRFSYLRVIARGSVTTGARYLIEGSLRRAGTKLRVAVQLVDTESGAHLWAEAYDRDFEPDDLFALQDDLVPRIVSTCADHFGVLARAISEAVRGRPIDELSPYEALMRGFGYHFRLSPDEHAQAREALERAVEQDPSNADCQAMLAWVYAHEVAHGFNPRPGSLDRALSAARKAVDLAPSNHLAQQVLAVVLFFRKEKAGCLSAAERSMALNPLDGSNEAIFLITFLGEWERGCALTRRAMELNPHHPGWYGASLAVNEYRKKDYRAAVDVVVKSNAAELFWMQMILAAAHGQLGELEDARKALHDLLALKEDFARSGRKLMGIWFEPELVEHFVDGLEKAGLEFPSGGKTTAREAEKSDSGARQSDDRPGIAVLPFVNMSDDRQNEFFSDGVMEEILTTLSKIDGLHVISRTSAMAYKGTSKSIGEIASELGVSTVLEGSVRRDGDRVRVTAKLIEASTDRQLWGEQFDRDLDDIFEVQSEIAVEIAGALETELAADFVAQIRQRPTENMTAYDLYLQGRQGVRTLRAPEILRGIGQLEEAIALDREFAAAHAEIALAHLRSAYWGAARGRQDFDEARAAADRALELDPGNAVASVARAGARCLNDLEWQGAVDDLHDAIRRDPNEVEAHHWLGMTLFLMQRFDEAVAAQEAALALDPQSPNVISHLAVAKCFSGRQEEGLQMLRDGFDQNPVFFDFPNFLAIVHKMQDRFDEASRWYERACELTGRHPLFEGCLASTLGLAGRKAEAGKILSRLRSERDDPRLDGVSSATIAMAEPDLEMALKHFNEAADQRLPLVFWYRTVMHDRELPAVDPGVQELWRRLWPYESEDADSTTAGHGASVSEAVEGENSIVVLPFANLSPDPDTEYFSDGLTDEIITDLSRVQALRVISRSSAMRLKGDERGLADIGRDLACRYVLEGSVRRAANDLRITARLVDAPDDLQLWADKYGGTLDDVFDIQERVSRSIVDALEIQLTPQEAAQLAERPIDDIRAQESYLRARNEAWSFMPGSLDLAISHLEAALRLVGDNTLIYQGLGECYFQYVNIGAATGREEEFIRKAESCVDKIFALEPESPRGYLVRAQVRMARGDIHDCSRDFQRVLQVYPNEIMALALYTHVLGWLGGQPDAAAPVAARLVDIDPLNPMSRLVSAMVPMFAGRFSEAVEATRRMFDLDPVTPVWRANHVMALSYARQFDEAEALTDAIDAQPDSDVGTWQMGLFRAAWREDREEVLRLADGPYQQVAEWDAEVPWLLACAHAAVGAADEALQWLERAIDHGMINYPFLSEHDWYLDRIRGDGRFKRAMERAKREWKRLDEVTP